MNSLDISVVVGARPELARQCLSSVAEQDLGEAEIGAVFVTINRRSHELAVEFRRAFPDATIIVNDSPKGFAANHNEAVRRGQGSFVAILNDDLMLRPGCLKACLEFMTLPGNQDVAMLSPRLLNPDGSLQPSTYSFPSVLQSWAAVTGLRGAMPQGAARLLARLFTPGGGRSRFWAHDEIRDVDTFRGACMVAKRQAIEAIGPMDEVSLVGGEETEWHLRARKAGYRVVFFPRAEAIHLGGQTIRNDPGLRNEFVKGQLNLHMKHSGAFATWMFQWITLVSFMVLWPLAKVTGRSRTAERAALGIRTLLRHLHNGGTGWSG